MGAEGRSARPDSLDRDPTVIEATTAIAQDGEGRIQRFAGDALPFLRSYHFMGNELVYCDQPYLFGMRNSGRALYAHEMDDAQHHALLGHPDRSAIGISGAPHGTNSYAALRAA